MLRWLVNLFEHKHRWLPIGDYKLLCRSCKEIWQVHIYPDKPGWYSERVK
jgi:hypothetical protein